MFSLELPLDLINRDVGYVIPAPLGHLLGRKVYGHPARWMAALVGGGVALAALGAWLDIA